MKKQPKKKIKLIEGCFKNITLEDRKKYIRKNEDKRKRYIGVRKKIYLEDQLNPVIAVIPDLESFNKIIYFFYLVTLLGYLRHNVLNLFIV